MKRILLLVFSWILIVNAFALVAWNRMNVTRDTAYGWIDPNHLHAAAWDPLKLPERWDSEWYLDIAKHGYIYKGPESLSNIVFFPVYPALIAIFGFLFFGQYVLAGWVISLASLVGASLVLARLAREFHKKLDPEEVVFFLLLFPTAIFFDAVYTESLFLFLSVSAIYLARKRSFVLASVVAAIAAVTRVTGVLLFIPLVMEFVSAVGWKKVVQPRVLSVLLIPSALGSFFLYHWIRFGSPTLFFQIEKNWGRSFSFNAEHFQVVTSAAQANLALDVFFFVCGVGLSIYVFRKIRASYAVYMLATIAVAVSTGTLMSIGRYILVLFPMYLGIASMSPSVKRAWMFASGLLFALYTLLFAQSYWAG